MACFAYVEKYAGNYVLYVTTPVDKSTGFYGLAPNLYCPRDI